MMSRLAKVLIAAAIGCVGASSPVFSQSDASSARFLAPKSLPGKLVDAMGKPGKLAAGGAPVSVASARLNQDGSSAIVTGYSSSNGGFVTVQHVTPAGGLQASLETKAHMFDAGLRPDFIALGDLRGSGHEDAVVAARGGTVFSVLLSNGKGSLAAPKVFPAPGSIQSLEVLRVARGGGDLIAVGTCSGACKVGLYHSDGSLLGESAVEEEPRILVAAPGLNGHAQADLIVGGSSRLMVVDGDGLLNGHVHTRTLPVTGAVAAVPGNFMYDRRGFGQIAVLTGDGSVHVFARQGLDQTFPTREELMGKQGRRGRFDPSAEEKHASGPWVDADVQHDIAVPNGSAAARIINMRLSGSGGDDIVLLNVNGGKITTVHYPVVTHIAEDGGYHSPDLLPARVTVEPDSAGDLVGAAPARIAADARMSLVMASVKANPLTLGVPAIYHTYAVGTTADGAAVAANCPNSVNASSSCTLRDAIAAVNADASTTESNGKVDQVILPSGTITLTYNSGTLPDGSRGYHIEINGPIDITGNGSASIISANNNDKVFSTFLGIENGSGAFDIFFSGLTLENGDNLNNLNNGANAYAGIMDWDTNGGGYFTIANCSFLNGTSPSEDGGVFYLSNENATAPGVFEADNSTFSGNKTAEGGGAIFAAELLPLVLTGDTFSSNSTTSASGEGNGGAIFLDGGSSTYAQPNISGSTFTGNTAVYFGGGAIYSAQGLKASGNTFTSNSATDSSAGFGGAVLVDALTYPTTITTNKFTTNSAHGGGGAISVYGSGTNQSVLIQYNVISGNNSTSNATGLDSGANSSDGGPVVTATDNFWGCNGAAAGTGCDTAAKENGGLLPVVSPYAMLTASLNTTTPSYNSLLTLTGGITKDSNGGSLSADEAAFTGLADTIQFVQNTITLYTGGTALSQGGTDSASLTVLRAGPGTASITVKNATASVSYSVINTPLRNLDVSGTQTSTAGTATPETANISITFPSGGTAPAGTVTLTGVSGSNQFTASGSISGCGTSTCSFSIQYTTNASLPAGTYTLTPSYTDTTGYYDDVSEEVTTGTLTIQPSQIALSSFTLSPSPITSVYGSTSGILITAAATGSNGTPTGTVSFSGYSSYGSLSSSTCVLSSGSCSVTFYPNGATAAGSYTSAISASLPSSTNYLSGTANDNLSITAANASLSLSPSPIISGYGSTTGIMLTATASSSAGTPSGTVTFSGYGSYGSLNNSTCVLSSGSCSVIFTPNGTTAVGSYTSAIAAALPASTNYQMASSSDNLTITAANTTLAIMPSLIYAPQGSTAGITLTFTATASGNGAYPTGQVNVGFSGAALGTFNGAGGTGTTSNDCVLSGGTCSVTFVPSGTSAGGSYSNAITASLTAAGNYNASGQVFATVDVSTITLTLSPSPVSVPYASTTPVAITATAAGNFDTPTGTVTFSGYSSYGSLDNSSCTLNAGSCTVNFTPNDTTAVGEYPGAISANLAATAEYGQAYAGDQLTVTTTTPPAYSSPTVLHAFGSSATDASSPMGNIVAAKDGNYYGMASAGGANGQGAIYRISPSGGYSVVYSFSGYVPNGSLLQASDGNLYGTMQASGVSTVFTYNIARNVLYQTYPLDGLVVADLIPDSSGHLYGVTTNGGANSQGSIFQVTIPTVTPKVNGSVATVYSFTGGTDGGNATVTPVIASDGYLYGATAAGCDSGYGGMYQYSIGGGTINPVICFSNTGPILPEHRIKVKAAAQGSTDINGYSPSGGLVENGGLVIGLVNQTSDGYGGAAYAYNEQQATGGVLYDLDPANNDPTSINGGTPFTYGTQQARIAGPGGSMGQGALVYINGNSAVNLYDFTGGTDGGNPVGQPVNLADGSVVGTTSQGGANGQGTVYDFVQQGSTVITLTPSVAAPSANEAFTLNWQSANAYSDSAMACVAFSSDSTFNGYQPASGSMQVTPAHTGTHTYNLTCGGVQTATATVNVMAGNITLSSGGTSLATTNYNFGSVAEGSSAPGYTITLTNNGYAAFPFGLTITGSKASQFSYTTTCGSSIAPSASCNVTFGYTASARAEADSAVYTIGKQGFSFTPNNTGTLSATSVAAGVVSVSSNSHSFGAVTVGSTNSYAVTLSNGTGAAQTVSFSGAVIKGGSSQGSYTTTCGGTLAVNGSCTLTYTLAPTAAVGAYEYDITVSSSATVKPAAVIKLTATINQ